MGIFKNKLSNEKNSVTESNIYAIIINKKNYNHLLFFKKVFNILTKLFFFISSFSEFVFS